MSVFMYLCGGLGNQMFQIANGVAYAKRTSKCYYLPRTWGGMSERRPSYWDTFFQRLERSIIDPSEIRFAFYVKEQFPFQPIPIHPENVLLDGYFQSEKYFSDCKEEIRDLFYIPLENPLPSITVAIHIRRGDYLVEAHFHKVLQKDYYDAGKKIIEEKLGYRPNYIYFSDDPNWVKETFRDDLNEKDIIREGYKDYEDMILMMNCHHFIMGNSTFSWWGAWLSKHKEKIVICPKVWRESYGDFQKYIYFQTSLDTENKNSIEIRKNPPSYSDPVNWEDLYCEGWIRV
jgi:hypothetical protein